jgi:hypothetical protein
VPLYHLEQPTIVIVKQTRAFVWTNIHTSSTNATTDMRDQAARSESRILGLPFHAQVGQTHQAGETAPGFGDGRSSTLSQLAETNCAVFPLQHHFHPNVYSKMNMTSMRPVRQLFKYLTSATKSFGTYNRTGSGASWGWHKGGPSSKLGASALLFLNHSSRRQRVFLAIS